MNARVNSRLSLCIVPCLRYDNAPAAIKWLVDVFGFEEHLVVPGENDTIVHAQLSFGPGMIMLGSDKNDGFGTSSAQARQHHPDHLRHHRGGGCALCPRQGGWCRDRARRP